MSNWTPITADNLKAAGYGTVVDKAQTVAVGGVDPVAYAIASAVAFVRISVAAGNTLDTDATKVPNSLEAVTARMAFYKLMERIGLPLSDDQGKSRDADLSLLSDLRKRKLTVETPDSPDTTHVPNNRGSWNSEQPLDMVTHPVPPPSTQWPTGASDYANPNAPADN